LRAGVGAGDLNGPCRARVNAEWRGMATGKGRIIECAPVVPLAMLAGRRPRLFHSTPILCPLAALP